MRVIQDFLDFIFGVTHKQTGFGLFFKRTNTAQTTPLLFIAIKGMNRIVVATKDKKYRLTNNVKQGDDVNLMLTEKLG